MKRKYEKEVLQEAVLKSFSYREVSKNLEMCESGRNFYTIKKYINKHGISTAHFLNKKEQLEKMHLFNKISNDKVIIKNSSYTNGRLLKKRILALKILSYSCSICSNKGD